MYLAHKFRNVCCQTNYQFIFFSWPEKLLKLDLPTMPNVKSKRTFREFSQQPRILVLGNGAIGSPSNVVLTSGNIEYLINCGEGSQKLGNEYKISFSKMSHVFITSHLWKHTGGLPGLALASQRPATDEIYIHGHNNIENIFFGMNKFLNLRYNQPKIKKTEHYEEFTDDNIIVKYIHLYSSSQGSSTASKGESSKNEFLSDTEVNLKSEEKSCHSSKEMSKKKTHWYGVSEKYVVSFIFKTKKINGALFYEKCVEFGVPPGPLLGILKSGRDVTLSNGKLVRSLEVKEPDIPGSIIIVVDCPTVDYLDSLLKEPIYSEYQSGENVADVVIHFSSSEVVKNSKYQGWINLFPKKTKHLFLNEDNKLNSSVSIHRQQFKLNYLQPDIFPILPHEGIPDFPRAENCVTEEGHVLLDKINNVNFNFLNSDPLFYKCESNSFISAETMCTLCLNPKSDYDYMKCLVLNKKEFLNEMFENDLTNNIDNCKEKLAKLVENDKDTNKQIYPKIVFLGTGSGKPSKMRNASGILVFLDENKCMLFDCGESTFNQLVSFYGVKKVEEILKKLVAIYVSHLHVDHHLGLITLLKERKIAFDKQNELLNESDTQLEFQPVYLLAPLQIRVWLNSYSKNFENIYGLYDLMPNSFLEAESRELVNKKKECLEKLNLKFLMTVPVIHCPNSYGISIVHMNGWKLTYSGDTRPCNALVKLGMNSDILIHEATFEDAFASEAKVKSHSTTGEAIEIGMKMNAKYILLTHFSQRYNYLPVIEDYLKNLKIGIAFDFMEVPYNKLSLLPELLESLRCIFSENNRKNKVLLNLKRKHNEEEISEENSVENIEISAKITKKN